MRPVASPLVALLALAACSSEPEVDVRNATVDEVANKVAEAQGSDDGMMRPGKWLSKATIEDVSIPGLPPEHAARMKDMVAAHQPRSVESCLTPEQASKPREEFFAGKNNQCRYDHFKMGGGKIDAKMRCAQGQGNQVIEMSGTYSPESYAMNTTMTQQGGTAPVGEMKMRLRFDAKRVGECQGRQS